MIWVKKIQEDDGNYEDASNNKWRIEWIHKIYCPCGLSEEEHGYEKFNNIDEAISKWGLSVIVTPELEENFI